MPVANALVQATDFSLQALTDVAGRFAWPAISLPEAAFPTAVEVFAPGYGTWRIEEVRFRAGDTLILDVALGPDPVTLIVPGPRDADEWPTFPTGGAALSAPLDDQSQLPLPATIRVRVTGYPYCDTGRPYTVETIDFKEYVKHVLPNEWGSSWPTESIRAGAMATKMYAWSYIAVGGKWPDADVYDSTCDQVYNPAVSYASTNKAVDFTWNWRLLRSDGQHLFRTFYRAYASQCADAGLTGYCMGQYEFARYGLRPVYVGRDPGRVLHRERADAGVCPARAGTPSGTTATAMATWIVSRWRSMTRPPPPPARHPTSVPRTSPSNGG